MQVLRVTIACAFVAVCWWPSDAPAYSEDKEERPQSVDRVKEWLRDTPFANRSKSLEDASPDEWVKKGKAIPKVEASLIWLLKNDKDSWIRFHSVFTLNELGPLSCIETLITSLEKDPDDEVKGMCATALGLAKDARATPALCKATESRSVIVRFKSCTALGRIGGTKAVECLKKVLAKDEHKLVREAAEEALAMIAKEAK
jgi:HEAT repeat protein